MARGGAATKFPGSPDQLAEMLADPDRAAQAMGGTPAEWRQFQNEYAARAGGSDLETQIREQAQIVLTSMLKGDRGGGQVARLDLSNGGSTGHGAFYNKRAPGARVDAALGKTSLGDFFANIHHDNRSTGAAEMRSKIVEIQNAMSSTVPSDGGFLIPESLRSEILALSLESAIVRPRARVIPMSSLRLPIPAVDEQSHASSVFGGLTASWTEESASLTDSEAKFGRVVLEAKKLTISTDVPNELVADAPALGGFIEMAFPATLAFEEDAAFIAGNGVGEPLGYLGAPATIEVAKESGQVADTIVWENIVAMFARLNPSSLTRAVWVVSPDTFPELMTMGLSIGTGGSAVWAAGDGGVGSPPGVLLGRPVLVSEKAPKLGDAGDVSFVDFGHYLIGDRMSMSLKSSEHARFKNDETSFRAISRVDGRPGLLTALTPRNGGPTLSPFVKLGARA